MAFATYGDLKSQVASYLNRNNLTVEIPYFVQLAETRIFYGSKEAPYVSDPLRIRAMEQCASASFATQEVALPNNFLQLRRLFISGSPNQRLDFLTPDMFWDDFRSSSSGEPTKYTIEGNSILLAPIPDGTYTGRILYYKRFDPLSADTDTNWLLTNAPNVYLYGTLLEAYKYVRNVQEAQHHLNTFQGIINALVDADKMDRYATPWIAVTDTGNP